MDDIDRRPSAPTWRTFSTRMQELEVEARAAIVAEDVPMITHTAVADGEDRELRSLIDRANIGHIFEAALEHRSTDGAEAELQAHYRLAANAIPLALLETRAVTPAPSDVGQNHEPRSSLACFRKVVRGLPGR